MHGKLKSLLARPGYRYLLIGGSVYGLELVIIVIAQHYGASAPLAVGISFCIGTLISFFLQKLVTFNDKRMHRRVLVTQMFATTLLIGWNLAFSVIVTKVLEDKVPAVLTRTLALGITTIWNFYIYKTRIFKAPDPDVKLD